MEAQIERVEQIAGKKKQLDEARMLYEQERGQVDQDLQKLLEDEVKGLEARRRKQEELYQSMLD